jgi:hypothetical protein
VRLAFASIINPTAAQNKFLAVLTVAIVIPVADPIPSTSATDPDPI